MFAHDLRSDNELCVVLALVARPREERTKIFCWSIWRSTGRGHFIVIGVLIVACFFVADVVDGENLLREGSTLSESALALLGLQALRKIRTFASSLAKTHGTNPQAWSKIEKI